MNNTWAKRVAVKFICASGNEVMASRPSPSLALKAGKYQRLLQQIESKSAVEQMAAIEALPDAELDKLTEFAGIVLADAISEPPMSLPTSLNKTGPLSPHDIPPADFWEIFMWVSRGCPSIPVGTKDGETTVEAVSSFPVGEKSSTSISSDSESIQ